MRLLNTETKKVKDFFTEQLPDYAILSHTWGSNTDEVTLQELNKHHEVSAHDPAYSSISSRPGYKKIEGCCDQAFRDGYEWAWIDTCCIDKTSSMELSEAINSMFRWYKESKVCYALLSDVSDAAEDCTATDSAFRKSKWFTRGWTLQELLAPEKIQFFNRNWEIIGQLTSGTTQSEVTSGLSDFTVVVSQITSIPPAYLEGWDLRDATIAQKMSWASRRHTKRKEDASYSLLGIFNVNMPLLYGEGQKAFRRLQEEVLKQTDDHTLLAWGLPPGSPGHSSQRIEDCSVFATEPADFKYCGDFGLRQTPATHQAATHQMTNRGLQVELKLVYRSNWDKNWQSSSSYLARLNCTSRRQPLSWLQLPLNRVGDRYRRTSRSLYTTTNPEGLNYNPSRIIILAETGGSVSSNQNVVSLDFPLEYRHDVKYIHPEYRIQKDRLTMSHNSLRVVHHPSLSFRALSGPWNLWVEFLVDIISNLIKGRPFAPRPRTSSSVRLLLQLKNNSAEAGAFLVCLKQNQVSLPHCYLARLHLDAIQALPEHHATIPQISKFYKSLTIDGNKIRVYETYLLNGHMHIEIAKEQGIRDEPLPSSQISYHVWYQRGVESLEYLLKNHFVLFFSKLILIFLISLSAYLQYQWGASWVFIVAPLIFKPRVPKHSRAMTCVVIASGLWSFCWKYAKSDVRGLDTI